MGMSRELPPRSHRGALLGFSAGQLLAIVLGLACLIAATRAGVALYSQHHPGQAAGAAAGLVAVGVGALVAGVGRWRGRRLTEWLPVLAGFAMEHATGQNHYRGTVWGADAGGDYPDLPGELAALRWLACTGPDGRSPIGLLLDTTADTVTAVLATSGPVEAGALVLADDTEQERRLVAWSGCMRALAVEVPALRRWQWLVRTMPESGAEAAHWLASRAVRTDTAGFAANAELVARLAPVARRHEVMLAVVIGLDELRREIRALGAGPAGQAAAVWHQLARIEAAVRQAGIATGTPTARLRPERVDGVTAAGWYTPRGLAGVLRTQFCPDDQGLLDSRAAAAQHIGAQHSGGQHSGGQHSGEQLGDGQSGAVQPSRGTQVGQPGVTERLAGPAGDETTATTYAHDGWVSRTLWVYEPPRHGLPPTWLVPLLTQPSDTPGSPAAGSNRPGGEGSTSRHTVSLIASPVRGDRARWQARRDLVAHGSEQVTRSRLGLLTGARDRDEAAAARRVDAEMAAGHTRYYYDLLVTVTAADRDELRRAFDAVRLRLSDCETVPLDLEQAQGFWAGALPLGRGMAPVRGLG
jgi:hypothetical protein